MKVLLSKPRGFCAGVERAIDTVKRALELKLRAKSPGHAARIRLATDFSEKYNDYCAIL